MYIEKNHDMVDADSCHISGIGLYESDVDNALVIGFDAGMFILEDGQTAGISLDEGTTSLCTIGEEKHIFTTCAISVVKGCVAVNIITADDGVLHYLFNFGDKTLNNIFFGIQKKMSLTWTTQ